MVFGPLGNPSLGKMELDQGRHLVPPVGAEGTGPPSPAFQSKRWGSQGSGVGEREGKSTG